MAARRTHASVLIWIILPSSGSISAQILYHTVHYVVDTAKLRLVSRSSVVLLRFLCRKISVLADNEAESDL